MMQKINVGIDSLKKGWLMFLNQEMIPYENITFNDKIDLKEYSAIIITNTDLKKDKYIVFEYIKSGGVCLTTINIASKMIKGIKLSNCFIKTIDGVSELFNGVERIWLEQDGFYTKYNSEGKINDTINAIYSKTIGKGMIIALPFDPDKAFLDLNVRRRIFVEEKTVAENVSKVSKGSIRRLIFNCLLHLHNHRKIPLVHLWYYPYNYLSAFNYRLDVDGRKMKHNMNLLSLADKKKLFFSWFFNMSNYKNDYSFFRELVKKKQDVQSHGYKHIIYDDYYGNFFNNLKADCLLRKYGITPCGYSSPHGEWNATLYHSLYDIGYSYSSDFQYDYDNYPSFISRTNTFLQIPIHPISIGSLLKQDCSINYIKRYFEGVINKKYELNLPLFFYCHPENRAGKYSSIVEYIINSTIKKEKVWFTTLTDFSLWWKNRSNVKFYVYYNGKNIKIITDNKEHRFSLRIIKKDKYVITPLLVSNNKLKLTKKVAKLNFSYKTTITAKKEKRKIDFYLNKMNLFVKKAYSKYIDSNKSYINFSLTKKFIHPLEIRAAQFPIVLKYIRPCKNKTILDAGCYDGLITIHLPNNNKIFGIDIDRKNIMLAKYYASISHKNISFNHCDINCMPFSDSSFDIVFCSSVLQYMNNPSNTLSEFNRVLKKNGKLVLIAPSKKYYRFIHKWAFISKIPLFSLLFTRKFPKNARTHEELVKYYTNSDKFKKFHVPKNRLSYEIIEKLLYQNGFRLINYEYTPNLMAELFRELRLTTPLYYLIYPIALLLSRFVDPILPIKGKTEIIYLAKKE